jgi:hypothetical protein
MGEPSSVTLCMLKNTEYDELYREIINVTILSRLAQSKAWETNFYDAWHRDEFKAATQTEEQQMAILEKNRYQEIIPLIKVDLSEWLFEFEKESDDKSDWVFINPTYPKKFLSECASGIDWVSHEKEYQQFLTQISNC